MCVFSGAAVAVINFSNSTFITALVLCYFLFPLIGWQRFTYVLVMILTDHFCLHDISSCLTRYIDDLHSFTGVAHTKSFQKLLVKVL